MSGLLAPNAPQPQPGFWRGLLDAFGQDAAAARAWFVSNMQRASGGGILGEGETDTGARAGAGMALGALGMTGAMPGGVFAAPRGAAMGAGPIRAYHGSPHDFDRFDISKIGTGEGAQAYGHGLYFAENEGVARAYRDALAPGSKVGGAPFDYNNPQHMASAALNRANGDVNKAIAPYMSRIVNGRAGSPENEKMLREIVRLIREGKDLPPIEHVGGRMYEVAIHADPERFLDWDKPLAQQAKAIESLEKAGVFSGQRQFSDWNALIGPGGTYVNPADAGSRAYIAAQQHMGADKATSAFRDAGIPGIRYLDAGSRGAKEGSRNYVVFDDNLIEILRKYGLLGPTVASAGLLASQDSEAAAR